jgi:hypothetical protein
MITAAITTALANSVNPLGENLLVLLTLAMGGALAIGNILALARPREDVEEGELERPPLGRTLIQIGIGLVAAIWALISLIL